MFQKALHIFSFSRRASLMVLSYCFVFVFTASILVAPFSVLAVDELSAGELASAVKPATADIPASTAVANSPTGKTGCTTSLFSGGISGLAIDSGKIFKALGLTGVGGDIAGFLLNKALGISGGGGGGLGDVGKIADMAAKALGYDSAMAAGKEILGNVSTSLGFPETGKDISNFIFGDSAGGSAAKDAAMDAIGGNGLAIGGSKEAADAAFNKATGAAGGDAAGAGAVPVKDDPLKSLTKEQLSTVNTQLGSGNTQRGGQLAIQSSDATRWNFLDCSARAVAKIALQKVTASTVNWINSGFKGSPAFVKNYDTFFKSISDQAANQFIQGSDLSYLSSAIQPQVRAAVAQTYAGYTQTPSNTMSSAAGDMKTFSQGGWGGFLSYTTVPTNNAFGALTQAEATMQSRINAATSKKVFDLTLGQGFLSDTKDQNCKTFTDAQVASKTTGSSAAPGKTVTDTYNSDKSHSGVKVCDEVMVTPGRALASALDHALGTNFQSLESAKYFDEIIAALLSQLVMQVTQSGLSTVSEGQGYGSNTYGQFDFIALNNIILQNAPIYITAGQQIVDLNNQDIVLIQGTILPLTALRQCWGGISSSTSSFYTPEQKTQAAQHAIDTDNAVKSWNDEIAVYQGQIVKTNGVIDVLNRYISAASTTSSNLSGVLLAFQSDVASGAFTTPADVTYAQDNQTSLQSTLKASNDVVQQSQDQCNALVNTLTQPSATIDSTSLRSAEGSVALTGRGVNIPQVNITISSGSIVIVTGVSPVTSNLWRFAPTQALVSGSYNVQVSYSSSVLARGTLVVTPP